MLNELAVLEVGETIAAASSTGSMLSKLGASATTLTTDRSDMRTTPGVGETQRDRLLRILRTGKREIVVGDQWDDDALAHAGSADIVVADVAQFPQHDDGWLDRYKAAVQRNDRGVWVSISPFGLHGQLRGSRGGDLVANAAGGIAHYMRGSDGRPLKPAGFTASISAGHYAALAAMHGVLLQRERGLPVHLDVSVQDTILVTGVFLELSHVLFECSSEGGSKNYSAPVGFIRCADGLVWLVVLEQHHWEGCVRAIGSPEWAVAISTREERYRQSEAIRARLEEWSSSLTAADCADRLQAEGVPATRINTCADLAASVGRDVREGFFVHAGDGSPGAIPGVPVSFGGPRMTSSPREAEPIPSPRRHRVLAVSQVLVAPLATSWLGAMGVDVLKIEDLSRPDVYRRVGPFLHGEPDPEASAYFAFANYSKRSYALELDTPSGRRRLGELMAGADAVVTNVSPHRADFLGISAEASERSGGPCVITSAGFGTTTSHARYRAYGLNIQAAGGVVHLTRDRTGDPTNFGTSWADPVASVWIAMATVAQLITPREQREHAEVSMVEAVAYRFPEYFVDAALHGAERPTDGNRLDHAAPHDVYRCAGKDAWLAVAVESDAEWRNLVQALGSPPQLADARFATHADRRAHLDELDTAMEATLASFDRDETFVTLQGVGLACAPVWNAAELVQLPHLDERGLLHRLHHPVWGERRLAGLPWRIVGEGAIPITVTPLLGEHTTDAVDSWAP